MIKERNKMKSSLIKMRNKIKRIVLKSLKTKLKILKINLTPPLVLIWKISQVELPSKHLLRKILRRKKKKKSLKTKRSLQLLDVVEIGL
jgi:hypothetical protein